MMKTIANWQVLVGCAAVSVAAVVGFSGAVAAAEPVLPSPPGPVYPPVTVTQTVTVAPHALGAAPAASPPAANPPAVSAVPAPGAAIGSPGVPGAAPISPSTRVPASSGTLRDYFASKDVRLEPQQPAGFTALNITLPVPPGWTQVPDPNVPDAFAVIADRHSGALYAPNAQLVVYRLVGHFDAGEAITHGFVDSQQLPAWRTTNASLADFGGFPSSLIEGTYRQGDMTLNTSQRHVIAAAGAHNYLVSLTVNTDVSSSVGHAPATDAVVNGFRVALPGATPVAAGAAAPSTSAAPAPSSLTAPSPATPRG